MEYYDKDKVGKLIAKGGDRKVYMYEKDKVIKFSSLSYLIGDKLHKKYNSDYKLCLKYLRNFIVETTNVSNKKRYIEISLFIKGQLLDKKHAKDKNIKIQLKEIVDSIEKMKSDGFETLDLVGSVGMIRPCLSNIIVDEENKLKIIDTILLEGKTIMPVGIILEIFKPLIIARQNYLIKTFLKE